MSVIDELYCDIVFGLEVLGIELTILKTDYILIMRLIYIALC